MQATTLPVIEGDLCILDMKKQIVALKCTLIRKALTNFTSNKTWTEII